MALRNYTKRLFAEALTDMMRTTPLEKIRVKDLCDRCGAQRQSFYYHFRDKYDLVAYIYSADYTAALESTGGTYDIEHAIGILRSLKEKQSFIRKHSQTSPKTLFRSTYLTLRSAGHRHCQALSGHGYA